MTAPLLTFPNEILLHIFSSASDIQTAARLGQTCRQFNKLWLEDQNRIINAICKQNMPAYGEAFVLAVAETRFTIEALDKMDNQMKDLVPVLKESASMCSKVLTLYEQGFTDKYEEGLSYEPELSARIYYRSRLIANAHDHPRMRRAARRRLKRLPAKEVRHHCVFMDWLVDYMADQDLRDWHRLGTSDEGVHNFDTDVPERWWFTIDTVNLYSHLLENPGQTIGFDGAWSNVSCQGYNPAWW